MPVTKGDVGIHYETRGPGYGIPLLLVQGFTWQLIGWREGFCQALVERGARVILYDNRDVGLSQKFGGEKDYDGRYGLADMAGDGFSVLDDLGLSGAHLVGASMGGMISQAMALGRPARVKSLNLLYTAPSLDMRYFVQHASQDPASLGTRLRREEAIEDFVAKERISASTAYPFDESWAREHAGLAYDRCYAPAGSLRQLMAMIRWPANPEALGMLDMPSCIVHGRSDRRVRVEAAFELARLLGNSELNIYPGMGHEIPQALWGEIATAIMRNAARAP